MEYEGVLLPSESAIEPGGAIWVPNVPEVRAFIIHLKKLAYAIAPLAQVDDMGIVTKTHNQIQSLSTKKSTALSEEPMITLRSGCPVWYENDSFYSPGDSDLYDLAYYTIHMKMSPDGSVQFFTDVSLYGKPAVIPTPVFDFAIKDGFFHPGK